jgi:hypothetical protein
MLRIINQKIGDVFGFEQYKMWTAPTEAFESVMRHDTTTDEGSDFFGGLGQRELS